MRFTRIICAIVSSLAVAVTAQVPPAPAPAPAVADQNDARLREAVRKALEGNAPQPGAPAVPAPAEPAAGQPLQPVPPTIPPVAPLSTYSYSGSTTSNRGPVALSLREAVALALEHNLDLKVFRLNPVISEYDRRALYGVYDPTFNAGFAHSERNNPPGGINLNTGNPTPGTESKVDNINAGLSGYLPTGLKYGFTGNAAENQVTTPFPLGTNSFGQPTFGRRSSDTWSSAAAFTATQPLLRDLWIDGSRLQIKLGRRNVEFSELGFERQMMDIVNRTEQAYYQLVAAREAVRVGESDVAVKKQFYEEQQQRVKVGVLAPLEEKLAQAELGKSESALINYRGQAVDAETILKVLIYDDFVRRLDTRLEPSDRLLALPASFELIDAFKEAMEKRPDLQQFRVLLERAQIQLKYTYNQLFPRLDLTGTLGYNGLALNTGGALDQIAQQRYEQSSVGIALSFPLWRQADRNIHKAARESKAQAIYALAQQEQIVQEQVDFEVRLIRTYWAQIPYTREVTIAEQAALEAEKKKLEAGKSTSFQVLKIATDLTTAQVNEIKAILIYNQALSELSFRKGTTLERWRIDRPQRVNR